MEVYANMDGTLFFIHENMIRNPSGVGNGVNEAGCVQILFLGFDCGHFRRINGPLLLAYMSHIGPSVDVVFHNVWIQPKNFSVRLGKDVVEFLEERFVGSDFFRGARCPQHDFFNNLRIV